MRPLAQLPALRRIPTAIARTRPRTVLFDSWRGRFSDSPRGIFEEMVRRDLDYDYVWVRDAGQEPPEGASAVAPLSTAHLALLGSAGHIVCNNTLPRFFRKRRGTTLVQSWHGTPLKRIGFDIDPSFSQGDKYLETLARESGMWDALISPNRFSTEIFRRAFRYRGRILETGYPRNDVLLSPQAGEIRRRVRASLGIDESRRAVLYAPTWRDNDDGFHLELDLARLGDELADHVFLLRAHHLVAATVAERPHPAVVDVSRHGDPAELYLAADVLITDYSSVMFDFALTGKPMLFYVYDLASYRDELRGFYFDLVADAPGPVLDSSGAVLDALRELDGAAPRHADAYRRFLARFGHLDDGHASARVVDAVFGAV
jgi:CDP-glycerol glycerophosphotransferase